MSRALELVESVYHLDADEDHWFRSLCHTVAEIAPPHRGVLAVEYRALDDGAELLRECHVDCSAAVLTALGSFMSDRRARVPLLSPGFVCDYGHRIQPAEVRFLFDESLARHGIWDVLAFKNLDRDGRGLWLGINLQNQEHASERERRRWAFVGTHVAAAHRLRQWARRDIGHGAEAVRAIDALRAAAIGPSSARPIATQRRRFWKELANGRWTLLDRFEEDGRRYLIARRNDPEWGGPAELNYAERQVVVAAARGYSNKKIAYQLGLPESTVSTQLSAAMRKLGAANRVDLVTLVHELL